MKNKQKQLKIKEKKIKGIQNQGQVKTIKKYTYDDENSPLISKQKEIFNEFADKRLVEEITKLHKKANTDDLIYRYKSPTADRHFDEFDNALDLINKIRGEVTKLADVKNDKIKLKSKLGIKRKQQKKVKRAKKRFAQH